MKLPVFDGFSNLSFCLRGLEYFFAANKIEENVAHIFLRRSLRGQAELWYKAIGSVILPEENESRYKAIKRALMEAYSSCLDDDDYEDLMISEEQQEACMPESVMNVNVECSTEYVQIEKLRPAKRKADVDEEDWIPCIKRHCTEIVDIVPVDIGEVEEIEIPAVNDIEYIGNAAINDIEPNESVGINEIEPIKSSVEKDLSCVKLKSSVEGLVQVKTPQEESVQLLKDSFLDPEPVESTVFVKQLYVSEPTTDEAKPKEITECSYKAAPDVNYGTGYTPSKVLKKFPTRKCDSNRCSRSDYLMVRVKPPPQVIQNSTGSKSTECAKQSHSQSVYDSTASKFRPPRKRWKVFPPPPQGEWM